MNPIYECEYTASNREYSIPPIFLMERQGEPEYYAPTAVWGNFLYLLEADEDDVISLIKYEIVGE